MRRNHGKTPVSCLKNIATGHNHRLQMVVTASICFKIPKNTFLEIFDIRKSTFIKLAPGHSSTAILSSSHLDLSSISPEAYSGISKAHWLQDPDPIWRLKI